MDQEKWDNIKGLIKEKFEIISDYHGQFDDRPGEYEEIIFQGPLGKMKVERLITPKVLDKKTTYSRRIGSDVKVDYIYDNKEKIDRLKAYKWDEETENWVEISTEGLSF